MHNKSDKPSPVEIVAMTLSHHEAALRLWQSSNGILVSDADSRENIARYLERNPNLSHVALLDGRLIGTALCGHDGRRGYLHHVAVAAEHRNRGIGRAVVGDCLAKLLETGLERCNLFVFDDNHHGKQFWTNGGWYEWPTLRMMSKELG